MNVRTPRALPRVLAGLAWTVDDVRPTALAPGERLTLAAERSIMVYVVEGSVALTAAGTSEVWNAGDLLLLCDADDAHLRSVTAARVTITRLHSTDGAHAPLPRLVAVRELDRIEPAVAMLAATMSGAGHQPDAASVVVCSRIVTTILTVAVRSWVELGCASRQWLVATDDPFLARVLDAIHADLARPWTVAELASLGAMSRSVFAERFRHVVGESPATYVTRARMTEAMRALDELDRTVAQTAYELGYRSEDGFSRAFRRHTGSSPSTWRAARRAIA